MLPEAAIRGLKIKLSRTGAEYTIEEYLIGLLLALWREGENFSGKRPLGDSGWEYEIYPVLIKCGLVKGELDEDGYVVSMDHKLADKLIEDVIFDIGGPSVSKKKVEKLLRD